MKQIKEQINRLNEEERKEFREFLTRKEASSKMMRLFDKLTSEKKYDAKQLTNLLYSPANPTLFNKLCDQMLILFLEFSSNKIKPGSTIDPTNLLKDIMAFVTIAIKDGRFDLAGPQLDSAEELAEETEAYDELRKIYDLKLKYSKQLFIFEDTIKEIEEKRAKLNNQFSEFQLWFTERLVGDEITIEASDAPLQRKILVNAFAFARWDKSKSLKEMEGNPDKEFPVPLNDKAFPMFIIKIYERLDDRNFFRDFDPGVRLTFLIVIVEMLVLFKYYSLAMEWKTKIEERYQSSEIEKHHLFGLYSRVKGEMVVDLN